MKNLLNVLIQSKHQLNPNQTAVIRFDKPLYTIAKEIQWFHPAIYGQQNLVLMLGAFHIEMVLLSCLGDWLQDFKIVGGRLLCQVQVLHHQEMIHYSQVTKLEKQSMSIK